MSYYATPWHKESYEQLLKVTLPDLLKDHFPLTGYNIQDSADGQCLLELTVSTAKTTATVKYVLPFPDDKGIFHIDNRQLVVIPKANSFDLALADIDCVGEQLYSFIYPHLECLPADMPWDEGLLYTLLPLQIWIKDFLQEYGRNVQNENWLTQHAALRQLLMPDNSIEVNDTFRGRVCPIDTVEGPMCGQILSIAIGAYIKDAKLIPGSSDNNQGLGLAAALIPCLEHNDPARSLMACGLMKQFQMLANPEPPLVQTGNEPLVPGVWTGCNLLTAFVSWGADTFDDAIVVSESAARKLQYSQALSVGDKLGNRHGSKGVISKILPDAEMPHLPDGTPIELIFSFIGLHTRLNYGQEKEAVLSWIAKHEGAPIIVPSFQTPSDEEISTRLSKIGLPSEGMQVLTNGKAGPPLAQPSLVGWVYWGVTEHVAANKMMTFVTQGKGQLLGQMEYLALRSIKAYEFIAEQMNIRSSENPQAASLPEIFMKGIPVQAQPPTPAFINMQKRLQVLGVHCQLDNVTLRFSWSEPVGEIIKLALPVPHPWLPERELRQIGVAADNEHFPSVIKANTRLHNLLAVKTPESLLKHGKNELIAALNKLAQSILTKTDLQVRGRSYFSGRAVLVPGSGLRLDQVGLAEEMAWDFFAPQVIRELGGNQQAMAAVNTRNSEAVAALDAIMAKSWVVINRAPTLAVTNLIAFHPVRYPDRCIHLHPLVCTWLNADFDGDQVAIYLPVTAAGQQEACEKLSVKAHLERTPTLLETLLPRMEALWGLAYMSLQPEGLHRLNEVLNTQISATQGPIDSECLLIPCQNIMRQQGVDALLNVLDNLAKEGFAAAQASGASINPLIGLHVKLPINMQSGSNISGAYDAYIASLAEVLISRTDYHVALGPQLLAIKSGARGHIKQLISLLWGSQVTEHGYTFGLNPDELAAVAAITWRRLLSLNNEWEQMVSKGSTEPVSRSFRVMSRAMRSSHPGVVLARAAAVGEVDPLVDVDSRLFVGLPVK
jgi:hypothetical protein